MMDADEVGTVLFLSFLLLGARDQATTMRRL